MATPKKKREDWLAVGRPTKYKPEFCQQVREMYKKGFARVEIACAFDINTVTLNEWAEKYPEFSKAINQDVSYSEGWWTAEARKNIKNKDLNPRLFELNMMNRFGWNKKSEGKQEVKIVSHDEMLKELK